LIDIAPENERLAPLFKDAAGLGVLISFWAVCSG